MFKGIALELQLEILANLPLIVYVSDLQTNELLFLSQYAQKQLGIGLGQICFRAIHGHEQMCQFCDNKDLIDSDGKPAGTLISEIYNARLDRWFQSRAQAMDWQGRLVRFEIAIDITERVRLQDTIKPRDEYYAALLTSIGDGVIVTDRAGKVTWLNPKTQELTGWSLKLAQGKLVEDVFHIIDTRTRKRCVDLVGKVLKTGQIVGLANHTSLLSKNGLEYKIADSAAPVVDDHDNILGVIVVFHDVTAEYDQQEQLRRSEKRFRSLFDHSLNAIALHEIVCDEAGKPIDYRFLTVNKAFEEMTDLNAKSILGKKVTEVLPGISQNWIEIYGQTALSGTSVSFENFSPELQRHYSIRAYSYRRNQFVTIFQDITERKKMEERLNNLAFRDSLTGLYNRRYCEQEMQRLDVVSSCLPLSVIIGDVNGLKIINDSLGHSEGDLVLKSVARALRIVSRTKDVIARWGGDEFVILLPNTDLAKTQEICLKIEEYCSRLDKAGPVPSLGLGCASKVEMDESILQVLKDAEHRMYQHKLINAQSSRSVLVASLQRTLAERSYETEEHARHLQNLAKFLGREAGLADSEVNTLSLVALLHDIGKVSIPESILNKSGPLTAEEWQIMRQHCESGYRILASSPGLLDVAEGVLSHHERWDGSGYPRGLKGEEIPLVARIVSIVDAYDAMVTDRPYRASISPMEALQEIKDHAGTQFDPELAKTFVAMMENQHQMEKL